MNRKSNSSHIFRSAFLTGTFILASIGLTVKAQEPGRGILIAVVDMQEALNKYHKTETEVKQLNEMVEKRKKEIEALGAEYKEQAEKMQALANKAKDTSLSESLRREAADEFKANGPKMSELETKLATLRQKAGVEVSTARTEMEKRLVDEIKEILKGVIAESGADLVFDKSFLPKANKAILHTSDKVVDLTTRLIEVLNAGSGSGTGVETGAVPAPQ